MSFQSIILISALALSFIIILIKEYKSKRFFTSFLISALSGVGALCAVNILSAFIGVNLPFNGFTLLVSSVMGIPGVAGLLIATIL